MQTFANIECLAIKYKLVHIIFIFFFFDEKNKVKEYVMCELSRK